MRIARVQAGSAPTWAIIEGETVYRLDGSPFESPSRGRRLAIWRRPNCWRRLSRPKWSALA